MRKWHSEFLTLLRKKRGWGVCAITDLSKLTLVTFPKTYLASNWQPLFDRLFFRILNFHLFIEKK